MKVITDYFSSPPSQTGLQNEVEESNSQPHNGPSDGSVYYGLRKIKIRLADPNVPDSYVCEAYNPPSDESFEDDIPIAKLKNNTNENLNPKLFSASDKEGKKSKREPVGRNKLNNEESSNGVLTVHNHPSLQPSTSTETAGQSCERAIKPAVLAMAGKETTNKRTRQVKEIQSKGSITNYFRRTNAEATSKKEIDKEDMDCVVLEEKLAPIFLPQPKKLKLDPEAEKARKTFLSSGLPENVKKAVAKAQSCLEAVSYWPVSHIQQRDENPVWEHRTINLCLREEEYYQESNSKVFRWPCSPITANVICEPKNRKIDGRALQNLKIIYKQIPIERLYNCIKERHRQHAQEDDTACGKVWSEKYRPSTAWILGNDGTVEAMKNWLLEWKRGGQELCRREDVDSSDEENCGIELGCLLEGPVASGKTALVYAVASELEMNVIEINASSKRSGKKLLSEIQEATRSHEVRERSGSALILVEDVDIVFEEDEGFISALQGLVSSTKRPVIMLTSDSSARCLDRLRSTRLLQLQMTRPHSSAACALLELICHQEGVCPPRLSLLRLLRFNNLDLRRSLLELQLWNGRGGWEIPRDENVSASDVWWASQPLCHNFNEKKPEESDTEKSPSPTLKNFTTLVDSLSYADVIARGCKHSVDLSWGRRPTRDSLSLLEDARAVNWRAEELSSEISYEILRLAYPATRSLDPGPPFSESRWIESQMRATDELVIAVPKGCGRAGPVDYFPALRTMLRAELSRMDTVVGKRRSRRGCYYLRSLGISPSATNSKLIANTFHKFWSTQAI